MCDLSTIIDALREQAQSAPEVTVKSEILLKLLDPVMVVTIDVPKKRKKREKAPVDPDDKVCAEWLLKVRERTAPKMKRPNIDAWCEDIRLMREQDGRQRKEICELFLWAHKDPFWRKNILCPETLRAQWDKLTLQHDLSREPAAPSRESVGDRNARLQAEFLGAQSTSALITLQLGA